MDLISGAGLFIYPLGLCSLVAVFIIVERLLALRSCKVMPPDLKQKFLTGDVLDEEGDVHSVVGRILFFYHLNKPDPDALKAFASLEKVRLERGMFLLETVIGAAPLIGLLGTVAGLITVFSGISPDASLPDPALFVRGIALALTTTMIGLSIAIPALVGFGYLSRRVDTHAAQIDVGVERLIDLARLRQSVKERK